MALKQLTAPFPYFGLLNVKPGHPVDNLVNRGNAALMLFGDCGKAHPANLPVCSYGANGFGVKLALRVPLPALVSASQSGRFATPVACAPFFAHISIIVCPSANAKVRGVATGRVVASVQKAHPVWYSADKELVC